MHDFDLNQLKYAQPQLSKDFDNYGLSDLNKYIRHHDSIINEFKKMKTDFDDHYKNAAKPLAENWNNLPKLFDENFNNVHQNFDEHFHNVHKSVEENSTDSSHIHIALIIGGSILVFSIIIAIVYKCYISKKHKNADDAPVVVTSSTHTTATAYGQSGGYHEPPYPTTNTSYPMPHPTTIAGGGHINPPYNTAPYPMHTNTGMPMPQSTGYPHPQPGFQTVPYPPPASDPQANPPSYDQVVGNTAPYNKQSAYNPHYSG